MWREDQPWVKATVLVSLPLTTDDLTLGVLPSNSLHPNFRVRVCVASFRAKHPRALNSVELGPIVTKSARPLFISSTAIVNLVISARLEGLVTTRPRARHLGPHCQSRRVPSRCRSASRSRCTSPGSSAPVDLERPLRHRSWRLCVSRPTSPAHPQHCSLTPRPVGPFQLPEARLLHPRHL